ncbi:MAG: hypothetical protein ACRDMX_02020 [Solirubrobacteraceae bacterium]
MILTSSYQSVSGAVTVSNTDAYTITGTATITNTSSGGEAFSCKISDGTNVAAGELSEVVIPINGTESVTVTDALTAGGSGTSMAALDCLENTGGTASAAGDVIATQVGSLTQG